MPVNTYTILDYPKEGSRSGNYVAEKPLDAAKEAFIKLSKKYDLTKNNLNTKYYLEFSLLNKNSNKKLTYLGTKIKLHAPITVYENGQKKSYPYKNLVVRKPANLTTIELEKFFNKYVEKYYYYNQNI